MPAYTLQEASHILNLNSSTLRSWAKKYIRKDQTLLSFTNLIEAHLFKATRLNCRLPLHDILRSYLSRIECDESGVASRLYPFTNLNDKITSSRLIVVDPFRSFGRPIIARTGIPIEIINQRVKAGEKIVDVAQDFDCEPEEIEEAIKFYQEKCEKVLA